MTRAHVRPSSYIAAACLEVWGLADERGCYEWRLLHLFRDEYIAKLPEGEAMLVQYREKERSFGRRGWMRPTRSTRWLARR